ncbi:MULTISPECIES: FG-GAP repeat domain-containing protein [Kitasatospora]|uniref:VCBS repeat-containing protein n=1 Tax=Kitasatospora cathayae TaxID=3004092 RepID=A0ABY7QEV9_9ACTN|nr:VCBS repeat-containing protein [Kitasatospora sp. HUAS 3-15]WBP91289.1 VCBS repeat-containing protein [Kitasatospora sp. HUAS 3-15]
MGPDDSPPDARPRPSQGRALDLRVEAGRHYCLGLALATVIAQRMEHLKIKKLRIRRIRAAATVIALLLASLSFSVGQASAYVYPGPYFEIQNQATGLCLEASPDYNPQQLEAHDCGTSDDQFFSIWNQNWLIDAARAPLTGGGICLATDSYSDALSVNCGNNTYALSWKYTSAAGAWTVFASPNGCYLKIVGDSTVACMPGFNGPETKWRMIYGPRHYSQTTAADFTGDGKADIIARDNSNGNLMMWVHDAGGGFNAPKVLTGGWDFTETTAGDFNNDGKADLIARDASGNLWMWYGNGDGTFTSKHLVTTGWNFTQTAAADFNGDGNVDLIAKGTDNNLYIWPGNGDGTFGAPHVQTGDWNFTGTRAADFNNDGKADILARDANGNLELWLHDGGGSFNAPNKLTDGWYFTQTAAADFNGDGKVDLIGRDDATGNLMIWAGNGDGTFTAPYTLTGGW